MKKIFPLSAVILAVSAISCADFINEQENGSNIQQGPAEELVPMRLSSGDLSMRTSLSGSDVHWTSDDLIAVFDRVNYANKFEASVVEGSSALFEGMVASGTTDFYAVYPFERVLGATDTDIRVMLPADQTPASGTFAEELNISTASGVKTPGEADVEGIVFKNICGLVRFTIPERLAEIGKVSFRAENRDLCGELTVSKSDLQTVASVSNGSNTVTMTGDFAAGSTFYFVVTPGEIKGFSVTVTAKNGATFTKTSAKSFTVEAGKGRDLKVIDFTAEPSADADHVYNDGVLSGTDVNLNLGLPSGMEEYVDKLVVEMKNSDGVTVRTINSSTAQASNTLQVTDEYTYLPQGEYKVSYTYSLNGVEDSGEVPVTVGAPEFSVFADAVTSYSLFADGNTEGANNLSPRDIYDIECSVSISSAVLEQLSLSSWSASITNSDGNDILDKNSQNHSTSYGQPGVFYFDKLPSVEVGTYKVGASAVFDGVEVSSAEKVIHVTGLPYKASAMVENDWQYTYPAQCSNGVLVLGDSKGIGGGVVKSKMPFHIPANVPVMISTQANLKQGMPSTFTFQLNGSTLFSQKCSANTVVDFSAETEFVPSGNVIKMESSYKVAGGVKCDVMNLYILYR